ncbi:MAG TPA: glycosyltransferase, partial [bacterium]|nr:glycosyltransferase [bacterium]
MEGKGDPSSMKIRLVLINDFTHIGGAEKVILQLCRYLQTLREGASWDIRGISSGPGPFADALNDSINSEVSFVDFNRLKREWRKPAAWRAVGGEFRAIVHDLKPDVILCNSLWSAVAVHRFLRRRPVPVIGAVHAAPVPKRR